MKEAVRRTYDLNGVSVSVMGSEEAHADFLDPIFASLATDSTCNPSWTITVRATTTVIPPPSRARLIWDRQLPEGLPSTFVEDDERKILVVPDHFAMSSIRSAKSTVINVTPIGMKSIGGSAAYLLLADILAAHGRHILHGGCMVDPATEKAVALFAPSGTGKTTTALALARNGLELAGDDALVLETAPDGFYLWGIPRSVKVHYRTAELLPWLRPVLKDWTSDEQVVGLDTLGSVIQPAGPERRRPAGAIVLMPPNNIDHRVEVIRKTDVLNQILTDNLRRTPTEVNLGTQAAFAAISRFIATTPTIAVSVGPDPASLKPAMILSAF